MEKYPLTSAGADALQAALYKLDSTQLQAEAELLAQDPYAWIAGHIELEVRQVEYLRNIDEGFMMMFGWNLAAALLGRRRISFRRIANQKEMENCADTCILYTTQFSCHFAKGENSTTGHFEITLTE